MGLAERVRKGLIRLPKFQREFVWSKQQVLDLLDSIAKNYPIGSLLLWKSPLDLAGEQNIAGLQVDAHEDQDDTVYVLDGCQRLSTICGALYWRPEGDPKSYWNLVYDLEQERFKHRTDLEDPPLHEMPLRLLTNPARFFRRLQGAPEHWYERAETLFNRFTRYEVAVVTLEQTSFTEVGRIFERINTRGTPLTAVEFVRAATWTTEFDLLDAVDRVRAVLADKHYGRIERKLLLRSIAAAAGLGFANDDIERLPKVSHGRLLEAIEWTEQAARHAVDFLTTEIGTPTAEALPYPNQLAVVIEIFRRLPTPDARQSAAIRSWFWRTALTGYYEGWNVRKMAADLSAITAFARGETTDIAVETPPLSTRLWLGQQYRRDSARTKAFALMLAAAGPRDLRTDRRIDTGRALARPNDMQFHHFFPKAWLMRRGHTFEQANLLANIVMLTSISNQAVSDQPPSAYLKDEMDFCSEPDMLARLETVLVPRAAFEAAMDDDYQGFLKARADALFNWASDLTRGARIIEPVTGEPDPEVTRHSLEVEITDTDTDD